MVTLSVREIVQRGSGPKRLAEKSKELAKRNGRVAVAEKAIYQWFRIGIPEKHWWIVAPECRVTEEELHRANEELRRARTRDRVARKAA